MNRDFVYNYLTKRDAALPRAEQELLRDRINSIKKKSVGDLRSLVERTKKNFEQGGSSVHIVKDREQAAELIGRLCGAAKTVAKAKSNTLDKLGLKEILGERLVETDLGAYIVSLIGGDCDHPVLPSLDYTAAEIAAKMSELTGKEYQTEPKALVDMIKTAIKAKIIEAEVGLTGANAIAADGQIMLLENEGNISLITRLPRLHIAVAAIEKIVPSYDDAIQIAKAAAVWGTGQSWPSYVSFIGGPSKTADIENETVVGVQGAQELQLILIEGDAYEKAGTETESMLYCIHCGACYDLCPTWNCSGRMPKVGSEETVFDCTLCDNCSQNCPARIDWQNICRVMRDRHNQGGKATERNEKMMSNIREFGNPFGDVSEGKKPTELFCC